MEKKAEMAARANSFIQKEEDASKTKVSSQIVDVAGNVTDIRSKFQG